MTYPNDNRPVADRARRNSPTGWIVGALFVVAIVAVVFFYKGKDSSTAGDPNHSPSVMTGSNTKPSAPGK
jgi:NADH:ubiquinone oxidoreductase subunit 6 (subunit J)